MLIVSEQDLGTPEAVWLADPDVEGAPALDLAAVGRLVVVAPHPDDEVLGAAGLMLEATARGCPVEIVAVTDGEASHPGSSTPPDVLARRRREESAEARRRLGLLDVRVHHLAIPDGHVSEQELALTRALAPLLDRRTTCVTPWRADGHPDHDATGRAAVSAAAATGAALLEFPVWAWHRCTSGSAFPAGRLRRLALPPDRQAAKVAAIDAFGSQIHPLGDDPADRAVLPRAVLARFERPFETYLVGPGR